MSSRRPTAETPPSEAGHLGVAITRGSGERDAGRRGADVPGGRRAWVITGMLLLLMMINFADKAVLGLAATEMKAEIGLTESQYGTVSGAFFLLFSLSALAVGFLADRFPAKRLLLWMALLWTVSIVPLLGTVSFGILLASRVFLGAAEGPTFGVANHAVQKWFHDQDRNLPVAVLNLGATLGVVIAAPGLTWVIAEFGWRASFATVGVIGLVWALGWLAIGKEGPVGTEPTVDDEASRLRGLHVPATRLFRSGSFVGAVAASVAAYWSLAILISYVPSYLEDSEGYSQRAAGTLVVLPWLLAGILLVVQGVVAGRLMARGVPSHWARGYIAGAGLAAAAVMTVAFTHLTDGVAQLICLTVAFSVSGMTFSASSTVCGELAPPQQRGSVLGTYVAVASLGGVLGPMATGRLIDAASTAAEGYATGLTVMAVVLALGAVSALTLMRPERDALKLTAHARPIA